VLIPPLLVSVAGAVGVFASFWSFSSECADFRVMVEASAPRVRTLGLIENNDSADRKAPGPWRHFTAYLMAEKGGYASNMPISYTGRASVGTLIPVRIKPRDQRPPLPRANPIIALRSFEWTKYGAGWDQFLIRDEDRSAPYDYFREHADQVELVARAGRWRLYRRKALMPRPDAPGGTRGKRATTPSAPSR
jgi:hypothetical protein